MKNKLKLIAACVIWAGAGASLAQQMPVPENVVQLSASGSVEAAQDLLSMSLSTTRDGADANAVQTQLKIALDAALTEAKKAAQSGQLDVRTGGFSLSPRYGRDGKPMGWQGTVELILEGSDFVRISATAGKIQTLTVNNVSFGLSRTQRAVVEREAQALAIQSFKVRASEIAQAFGFSGYTLRDVSVNANDSGYSPRPRMMAMEAKSVMADAPVPVEAGKTWVQVNVSGAVQLK